VYLDLLGGWREAHELGAAVRGEACAHLAARVDTRGPGEPLVVVNVQSWQRDDLASSTVDFPCPGPAGVTVLDDAGRAVPTTVTATTRHEDGTLASAALSFVATGVPATGYRTFRVVGTAEPVDSGWRPVAGHRAENDVFLIEADPSRGGALSRVLDKRSGKELLRAGEVAGGLVADDEYSAHPKFGKGPWHIVPTGTRTSTSDGAASVRVETSPAGQRIVSTCRLDELRITTEVLLWHGLDRLEFRTHVDGSIGQDRLLRVRFPLDVAGARPVYEVGNAVVGRTFGYTEVDTADHPFVLDSPAYFWAGVSSAARVELHDAGVPARRHAIGVAEIVAPESAALRDLVAALAQQGVTATTSRPDGSRCGTLRLDSNLPDVRLSIGGPAENAFTARVLAAAGEQYTAHLTEQLARDGTARVWVPANRTRATTWVPGADLRDERDLPVLVIAGEDGPAAAIADLVTDLTDATIAVDQPAGVDHTPAGEDLEDYSAALLNRGTPGMVVEPDGTLLLSLMRSCSEWPSGTWIDPPRRTAPDGSSFALQHWSHTFEYAVVCGAGDWRDAGFVRAGHDYNSRLLAHRADHHDGDLPSSASLLRVEPDNVVLTALKARGNPLAAGQPSTVDGGITVRCYETHGVATEARVTCFLPLTDGAGTDLHEQPHTPLDTTGGVLRLALGPAATATATAVPKAPSPPAGRSPGPHEEPVQPVFARYWLHNKGAAPLGHLPAQVYLAPSFVDLSGPTTVQVTVSATAHAAGRVELVAPPGVTVTTREDLRFDLDGDYRRFEALLRPEPGAVPGIRHLAARVRVGEGQTIEDVATVRIGDVDHEHRLGVDTETPALAVSPGVPAELRVRLTNHTVGEVRGEAQLISPFGTWEFVRPWTSGFTVPPGGDTVLTYQFDVPDGARSSATWAIVKVMAFGETHYTASIPLVIKA
jgi:hypothetical protein